MLNNITYSVNHTELFSIVASSADKYAIVTITGHKYGYACAFVSVFARTDIVGIHDELVRNIELTKDQITHFLSLDCPDAFIAYALTLCPCPPETLSCAVKCDLDEVDGGNLSYLDQLSSALCACGRVLSENDLSLMMCPICAQFKYNDDYDVPVNGMELPSNLE